MGAKFFYRNIDLVYFVNNKLINNNLITQKDRMLLSFSGGQDSICFIFILNQLYSQLEFDITFFWCHHLWQTDSFYLMQQITKLSFLLQFNSCFPIPLNSISSELLARKWRQRCSYRVSLFYNYSKICLAHTFNDKVENIFLNFIRGTGLIGLAPLRWTQFISKSNITNEKPLSCFTPIPPATRSKKAQCFAYPFAYPFASHGVCEAKHGVKHAKGYANSFQRRGFLRTPSWGYATHNYLNNSCSLPSALLRTQKGIKMNPIPNSISLREIPFVVSQRRIHFSGVARFSNSMRHNFCASERNFEGIIYASATSTNRRFVMCQRIVLTNNFFSHNGMINISKKSYYHTRIISQRSPIIQCFAYPPHVDSLWGIEVKHAKGYVASLKPNGSAASDMCILQDNSDSLKNLTKHVIRKVIQRDSLPSTLLCIPLTPTQYAKQRGKQKGIKMNLPQLAQRERDVLLTSVEFAPKSVSTEVTNEYKAKSCRAFTCVRSSATLPIFNSIPLQANIITSCSSVAELRTDYFTEQSMLRNATKMNQTLRYYKLTSCDKWYKLTPPAAHAHYSSVRSSATLVYEAKGLSSNAQLRGKDKSSICKIWVPYPQLRVRRKPSALLRIPLTPTEYAKQRGKQKGTQIEDLQGVCKTSSVPLKHGKQLLNCRKDCYIVRPLLSISRIELNKICYFWKLPIYPDKSNQKVKFFRNRVRGQLLPTIKLFFNLNIENIFLQLAKIIETEDYCLTQIVNEFTKNTRVYHTKLNIYSKKKKK